jgi:hypothetical protein
MQALMAGLRGISGIDLKDFNTRLNTFVLKKLPELIKRPRIRTPSFGFVSRLLISPFSNTRQVFNGNNSIGSFGFINKGSTGTGLVRSDM